MSLVNRAINILTKPKSEWGVISAEPATTGGLFTGYAVILALIPVVGTLLAVVLAFGPYRYFGLSYFLVTALVGYVVGLGVLYLMGIIANALSPSFDGTKNDVSAMKLVVYSATPIWVAGILSFIPGLGALIALIAFGYAAYLLYLGCGPTLNVSGDKAVGFTAVVIIIWIAIYFILSLVIIGALVTAVVGGAAMGGAYYR